MKAIILISSIFYILGLKISNKIDLVKKVNPVDKIITHGISLEKPGNAVHFNDAKEEIKSDPDSIKGGTSNHDLLLRSK